MILSKLIYGIKANVRIMLSVGMVIIGLLHFLNANSFVEAVSIPFPTPFAFVYISGFIEILAGVSLLYPPSSRKAAWILVILYAVLFLSNGYQTVQKISSGSLNLLLVGLRFFLQSLLIGLAWWFTQDEHIR